MSQNSTVGSIAIASGTAAGWTVASTFGNVGVVAGGTAFGLGTLPIMGAGAVAGAAAYGAYRGLSEGDPLAFSSLGLGAAAGAGVSAGIGGVGIVGGFGGVGLGLGAMTMMGGVAGLGLYGIAKMLDSPKESAFSAFSRMEERINDDLKASPDYFAAWVALSLPEDDVFRTIFEYNPTEDIAALKEEMQMAQQWPKTLAPEIFTQSQVPSSSTAAWQMLRQFKPHKAAINDIIMHPHEARLFSASDDGNVVCLDLTTGKRRYTFASRYGALAIALNTQHNTLFSTATDNCLSNWNLETGQLTEMLYPEPKSRQNNHFIHAVCAGARGKLFASAGADKVVTLWRKHELYNQRYRPLRWLKGHTDTVFSVALSSDERYLASGSADATIRVWDLELMWSEPRILKGHRGAIYAVAVCPTYPLLASAGQDGTLRLWDLSTGQLLKSVQSHSQAIRFLAFSPDGSLLVSSGNDNVTRLWSLADQEIVGEPRNLQVERQATLTGCGPAAFNRAGTILATSDRSGKLTLWRATQA